MKGRIAGVLAAAFLLAGCGKKDETGGSLETDEYLAWKGSQMVRQMAAAGPAEAVPGTVVVNYPEARSRSTDDFIELRLNGLVAQQTRYRRKSGAQTAPFALNITLRPGADWLDLWDSTTNRNYRFQVDPRQGTDFVFTPTDSGYDLTWTKRE